ncbi:MAG: TetR/AcrR family transcriptional regulator [Deltaproteobacteria bacterium]|nr:TetR/AcrR family transcriptional regulator [Deltaproteobacteria bacterium]
MKDSESKDVKETIIKESTRLFLANGFRGTSVKEITEAAKVGRGTLYWYFTGKDAILVTILRRFESEFLDGMIEAVGTCDGNFIEKFRMFIKRTTEYARDNRHISMAFTTLQGEMLGSNTEAEKVVRDVYHKYLNFVKEMLDNGKRDGTVDEQVDTLMYAHAVLACNTGMLMEWHVFGESLDTKTFVKQMRDILLQGILKKDYPSPCP